MTTLTQPFTVGEPQVAGPLTVFPGLGPDPRLAYRTFADAAGLGALVNELEGEAAVNEVVLGTPTELPLLAYEGEEILGAQQNRTFDISVLVYAQTAERVPVSCVERERWDGSRHDEAFTPSPQAADPALRARKRATANARPRRVRGTPRAGGGRGRRAGADERARRALRGRRDERPLRPQARRARRHRLAHRPGRGPARRGHVRRWGARPRSTS